MQSERIFHRSDGWYFRVRGNSSMGPYGNYREAIAGLERYVESCERQADFSFGWPRWLHMRSLFRRLSRHEAHSAQPREI